jgi:glycosyltransferase involved in cell wall biosynthesis
VRNPTKNRVDSVVIPTYNYGRTFGAVVDCVLAQTHRAVELIVVDDGSTGDTRECLADYVDRLRYIHQENQGLSAVRTTGIHAVRRAFVATSRRRWVPGDLPLFGLPTRGPRGNGSVTLRGVVTRDSESVGRRDSGYEGNIQSSSWIPTRLS